MITCITAYAFTDNLDKKIILGVSLIFLFAVFVFFDVLIINTMIEKHTFHFYGMVGTTFNEESYINIKYTPRPSGLARISLVLYASTCVYYLYDKTKKPIILLLVLIFGTFTLLYQSRTISFIISSPLHILYRVSHNRIIINNDNRNNTHGGGGG